jgi:glycosyltransferase involved in cell wall biosynthesis
MRIAVDARSYFMRTGIARYTRAMLEALIAPDAGHDWLLLISDRHAIDEVPIAGSRVRVQVSSAPWLGAARERRVLDTEASAWSADVFYSIFPPIALESVPSVVTIFDWIAWSHPQLLPRRVVRAFRAASVRALPRARSLVAVSEATATQLRQHVPDCARDVVIASCGVSPELLRAAAGAPSDADRQGVLFVGTIEPRKNVPLVVQAARELPAVPFTIAGKRGWGDYDLEGEIRGLSNVTWLSSVDDDELTRLYARAAVFVYPSQVEGFGLPVLEALAHGALPIVSTDPALGEIVSDRELTVDVESAGALSRAIARWLSHPDERVQRVAILREQAARFTWASGARVVEAAIIAAARGGGTGHESQVLENPRR